MVSYKGKNPDVGPKMMEGKHQFNKGYESDSRHFSPLEGTSEHDYRGNNYMALQNEFTEKDNSKLKRSKFSKIA